MTKHYVAHIKIEGVSKGDGPAPRGGSEPKREVGEVTQITLRADDLNTLKERIIAHVDLVAE